MRRNKEIAPLLLCIPHALGTCSNQMYRGCTATNGRISPSLVTPQVLGACEMGNMWDSSKKGIIVAATRCSIAAMGVTKEAIVQILYEILHLYTREGGENVAERHGDGGSTGLACTSEFGCG